MKKTLIIGGGLILIVGLLVLSKARQCFYEIGNGFFAGEALIPTVLAFIAFVFFARTRIREKLEAALCYFLIGFAALALMALFSRSADPISLFNPDEKQMTCALQTNTFPGYYLRNKTLYSNADFFSILPISVNKREEAFLIPDERCEAYLQSLDKWKNVDWEGVATYWICTEEWETDTVVYCFKCGDNIYVCPQSVYERCLDTSQLTEIGEEHEAYEENSFPPVILQHYNDTRKLMTRESLIIICYYVFGLIISVLILPKGKTLLASLTALPVGCGIFALIGYFSLLLHLPYNWVSFIALAVVIIAVLVLTDKDCIYKIKSTDYFICLVGVLAVACISIAVIYRAAYLPGGDTYSCASIGMNIAQDQKFFFDSIDWVASFGLFYSILNSQSYLVGGDYLYAVNVLLSVVCILLLVYFSYVLVHCKLRKYNAIAEAFIAFVSFTLFFSADFRIHIFYFLANMAVSVWFLIAFGLIILGHEKGDIREYWKIIMICFVMIIQSRIEGGIYVSFFLLCFLIDYIEEKYFIRLALFSLFWSLQLNIVQLIYNGDVGATLFWNPKRGLLLVFGLTVPLVLLVIKNKHWGVADYLFDRYYDCFVILAFVGMAALAYIKRGLATQNIVIFVIHIIENKYFWMMVFALTPIIMVYRGKRGTRISFSMMVILSYICMIFAMFLLRNDGENGIVEPLRVGMWDSGRRTLFQIMPTAAFLVVYEIVGWLKKREG